MMLSAYRLSHELGVHQTAVYSWIYGKYHPRKNHLEKLEKLTSIPPQAWSFPERFFNPYCPYRYTGSWPPLLDHLKGEAREWAEAIIRAFPKKPPTKEEFRAWRREQRRARKSNGGDG